MAITLCRTTVRPIPTTTTKSSSAAGVKFSLRLVGLPSAGELLSLSSVQQTRLKATWSALTSVIDVDAIQSTCIGTRYVCMVLYAN